MRGPALVIGSRKPQMIGSAQRMGEIFGYLVYCDSINGGPRAGVRMRLHVCAALPYCWEVGMVFDARIRKHKPGCLPHKIVLLRARARGGRR